MGELDKKEANDHAQAVLHYSGNVNNDILVWNDSSDWIKQGKHNMDDTYVLLCKNYVAFLSFQL